MRTTRNVLPAHRLCQPTGGGDLYAPPAARIEADVPNNNDHLEAVTAEVDVRDGAAWTDWYRSLRGAGTMTDCRSITQA
jgi:hypothetical protein